MKRLSLFFGAIGICRMTALGQERQDGETHQQELLRRQRVEEASRKAQQENLVNCWF